MTLGEKIKKLRVEKQMTQKELSDEMNVTYQTISKWEKDENEPDVATLRKLAKIFGCTLDYLLKENEDDNNEDEEEIKDDKRTIIIQKELHVCEVCKKDIPEDELEMEEIKVKSGHRGHGAVYRQAYYHKSCLEELHKKKDEEERQAQIAYTSDATKKCFGWSIFAGIVSLIIALVVFFVKYPEVGPWYIITLYSILIGYAMFAMLYCILSGSYIGDVFLWCTKASIKLPGIIFSWDLDGLIAFVLIKLTFAIITFLFGVLTFFFGLAFSATLSAISFPFVLIHNNRTGYAESFVGVR